MKTNLAWIGVVSSLLVACGGSTTTLPDGGSDAGSDGASNTDGSVTDAKAGDTGNNNDGSVSCGQPVSLTFANCPAAPTCGGSIVDGTYDYTTGCIANPWAQAQQNCQSLQVSNEQGTVQGCITFAAGSATRNVQSSYSATLDVPTSCLLGGSCAQLQTLLSMVITASCTASTAGCTCNVSSSYSGLGASSYTTSNNQVVTSVGNHYDYCVGTGTIDMEWVSGPNTEPGVYTLTKQ